MIKFLLVVAIFFSFVGFVLCADLQGSASSEPQQMQDFNIAGYGARGQKTWDVQGAQMDMAGNEIKITDITAHMYGENENMVLTADRGHFDKEAGVVHLQDHVKAVTESGAELKTDALDWSQKQQLITGKDKVDITKENMKAVGTGIEAQPNFKVAKLEKDVVVTVDDQRKTKDSTDGADLKKNKMVITCDGPMEMNYEKQFAVFEKNVKVEGDVEQGTMTADKMTVYFNQTTKNVDKVEAEGNVRIDKGENSSFSDTALFTAIDKRVVLTGRPKLVIFTEEGLNVSP